MKRPEPASNEAASISHPAPLPNTPHEWRAMEADSGRTRQPKQRKKKLGKGKKTELGRMSGAHIRPSEMGRAAESPLTAGYSGKGFQEVQKQDVFVPAYKDVLAAFLKTLPECAASGPDERSFGS